MRIVGDTDGSDRNEARLLLRRVTRKDREHVEDRRAAEVEWVNHPTFGEGKYRRCTYEKNVNM